MIKFEGVAQCKIKGNWRQFLLFDALCPSQQFFSYVGMSLPGLNQY